MKGNFYENERVALFIDGANLYSAARALGFDIDYRRLLKVFRDYLDANNMSADWKEVDSAPTEVLVNTLSLLAPYPPEEKQALLEAPDLKSRADVLVALTEMAIARTSKGPGTTLQ